MMDYGSRFFQARKLLGMRSAQAIIFQMTGEACAWKQPGQHIMIDLWLVSDRVADQFC